MLLKHYLLQLGGVANCPLRGVFLYTEKHLGNNLLSVIWSNGVSALEGLCMYGSYRENNQDPEINFVLYILVSAIEGCPLSRVSLYFHVCIIEKILFTRLVGIELN